MLKGKKVVKLDYGEEGYDAILIYEKDLLAVEKICELTKLKYDDENNDVSAIEIFEDLMNLIVGNDNYTYLNFDYVFGI